MEITKLINRISVFAILINFFLNACLKVVRVYSKNFTSRNENVVIVALHKLGDTVNTIPAINCLKNYYQKNIVILCFSESATIYNTVLTGINFCILSKNEFYFGERIASNSARKKLSRLNPEVIVDITGVMTSASLIFNSRAREIFGMNRKLFKNIYDYYTPVRTTPHLMDIYLDAISIRLPIENRVELKSFNITNSKVKKIFIHPFAGWKSKEWPLRKYIALAHYLKSFSDVQIIVPKNTISADVSFYLSEIKVGVIETNSINDLIEKIRTCSHFIGNDSGPLYIASLLGKSTFSIYGSTNPLFSTPNGNKHESISEQISCSPLKDFQYCFTNAGRHNCPSYECMNSLMTSKAINELNYFLVN